MTTVTSTNQYSKSPKMSDALRREIYEAAVNGYADEYCETMYGAVAIFHLDTERQHHVKSCAYKLVVYEHGAMLFI